MPCKNFRFSATQKLPVLSLPKSFLNNSYDEGKDLSTNNLEKNESLIDRVSKISFLAIYLSIWYTFFEHLVGISQIELFFPPER